MKKGSSRQRASPTIKKYTGVAVSPEWEDDDPGRVLPLPLRPVGSTQSQADKFQTLCNVEADISSAPYTSSKDTVGETGYKRKYEVILLVGLTELKAQICWKDTSVCAHTVPHAPI